jgi:hypothetical protein
VPRISAVVVAVVLLVTIPTPLAGADSQDDQFLAKLSGHGISGTPDRLIAVGHESCDAVDRDHFGVRISPYQVAMLRIEIELLRLKLSSPQISPFVRDARSVYCPDKE